MPIRERFNMLGKSWLNSSYGTSQRIQALRTHLLVRTLREDITYLPVIESVEDSQHSAHSKTAQNAIRCSIVWQMRQFEPQNVHSRRGLNRHDAWPLSHS